MDKNYYLANKKCLFSCLKEYYALQGRCVFKERVFPVTFHLVSGTSDTAFAELASYFVDFPDSVWILKPGEDSNRGFGIQVAQGLKQVEKCVRQASSDTIII
jgi:tubulin---tyrosine ligase